MSKVIHVHEAAYLPGCLVLLNNEKNTYTYADTGSKDEHCRSLTTGLRYVLRRGTPIKTGEEPVVGKLLYRVRIKEGAQV